LSKILLLVSKLPEDQEFAAEVALSAELTFKHVENFKDAVSIINSDEPRVIFVDASSEKSYQ
jgi:hypothetical protein